MPPGSDWSAGFNGESATSIADAELFDRIRSELRASYQALMDEPVPERLAVLLGQIDGKQEISD
jgi:anti-sigma factor NepR-like protein